MKKTIYSKEYEDLVGRLRAARKEAGLGQKKVAKLWHKTQSYISKIESGQLRIDVVQLKELARIYKRNLDFFIK